MKVTLHNTTGTCELQTDGGVVPARIWEGHTENGVPVIAFITRICAERDQDLTEFERDLAEQSPPSAAVESWPSRMVL